MSSRRGHAERPVVLDAAPSEEAEETWPRFEADEVEAVVAVLHSGRVNAWTGKEVGLFEREFAAYCGRRHATAVSNGSVALEVALEAIGLEAGDQVVVPARSFFATAGSVVRIGGAPVFADVDRETQNLDASTVKPCLTPRTRAVICVHLAGHACDMEPLAALCRERGVALIEDCAQAHGARYRGRPVGSFGDLGCFSFCQDKIMTTGGEGGMVLTDSSKLWERCWSLKDHGKDFHAVFEADHPPGFRWYHHGFGTNLRMTEMQAAIGRRQLSKLEGWVERRRANAAILHGRLADHPLLRFPFEAPWARHSFYKLYTFVRPERLAAGWSRDRIVSEIQARGIRCLSGSCPEIYLEKAFAGRPSVPEERLPVARELGETSMMVEVHPMLTESTIRKRAEILREVCDLAVGRATG
jgi:dTDP-4-amino-4,6-dideoxygalactose transaminase